MVIMMVNVFMDVVVFVSFNSRIWSRRRTAGILLFVRRLREMVAFRFIFHIQIRREFLFQPAHHLRHGPRLILLSVPVSEIVRRRRVTGRDLRVLIRIRVFHFTVNTLFWRSFVRFVHLVLIVRHRIL